MLGMDATAEGDETNSVVPCRMQMRARKLWRLEEEMIVRQHGSNLPGVR